MTSTAAFFDLDKTLVNTSVSLAYGKVFFEEGMISHRDALQVWWIKTSYMFSGMSDGKMDTTGELIGTIGAGWKVSLVEELAARTVDKVIVPHIYPEAREIIAEHTKAGRETVIVSASLNHFVEPIARHLGVDTVIASEAEIKDGHFTGALSRFCKGPAKLDAMRELAATRGVDLTSSYAYSDSATDIPMLEAVGHPVAVNPEKKLAAHAADRDWPILHFRGLKKLELPSLPLGPRLRKH